MYHNLVIGAGTETTEAERSKKNEKNDSVRFRPFNVLVTGVFRMYTRCKLFAER